MALYDQNSIERLQRKLVPIGDCLLWPLTKSFTVIRKGKRQSTTPRRMSFELANGEVPDNFHVSDTCGNRKCCNPAHLFSHTARFDDEAYIARLKERFWQKVNKNGPVPAHRPKLGNCWLWTGATLSRFEYGSIAVRWKKTKNGNPQSTYAHHLSYIWNHGSIPDGHQVCHKCDTPRCVRPDHLFTATAFGNYFDAVTKGRIKRRSGKRKIKANKGGTLRILLTKEQGERFITARQQKGLSIYDMAKHLEIDFTHYWRAEKGARGLEIPHFHFLLRYLEVNEQDLSIQHRQYFELAARSKWKQVTVGQQKLAA